MQATIQVKITKEFVKKKIEEHERLLESGKS